VSFDLSLKFFDENPDEFVDLGIEKPIIDVSLTYGKNKAIKHLVIGREKSTLLKKGKKQEPRARAEKTAAEMYMARDQSRPDLFFVDKDLVDKLTKSAGDLRDKALAPFQRQPTRPSRWV
jgi:hypothetical protein